MFFDNIYVPAEVILGREGEGFKLVMEALNASRPLNCGVRRAAGARRHGSGAAHVADRHAFGQQVSEFQGVGWTLADIAIAVDAARLLTYRAAAMVDEGVKGPGLTRAAAIAKMLHL